MKNHLKRKGSATIVMLCVAFAAIAQAPAIIMQSNGGDYYGTLDFSLTNPPTAVGIGNFPNTVSPASALHINTNTTMGTLFYNAGEVFRTNAPNGDPTFWRMLRGNDEYGVIYNNDDDHTALRDVSVAHLEV